MKIIDLFFNIVHGKSTWFYSFQLYEKKETKLVLIGVRAGVVEFDRRNLPPEDALKMILEMLYTDYWQDFSYDTNKYVAIPTSVVKQ